MNAVLKLTVSLAVLSAASYVAAFTDPLDQPARLSERAATSSLFGLVATRAGEIVAVGRRGHILYSQDGKSFTQSATPLSSDLVAVDFANEQQGWAVGHDGVILHSADAGKTWQRQLDGRQIGDLAVAHYAALPAGDEALERARDDAQYLQKEGPTKPLLDVFFNTPEEGWAIGAYNLILHTADGGKTWLPWMERMDNPSGYSLHAIRKVGDDIFIAGELGLLLRLDVAQQRFVKVQSPYEGSYFGLTGRAGLLVVFGLRGNAWLSRDAGNSWVQLKTGTSASINGGTALADGRIVLVTAGGELLVSDRQGENLQPLPRQTRTPLYGVAATARDVFVVGAEGIERVQIK